MLIGRKQEISILLGGRNQTIRQTIEGWAVKEFACQFNALKFTQLSEYGASLSDLGLRVQGLNLRTREGEESTSPGM